MDVKNGCFSFDCGNQKVQNVENANRCQISKKVREDVDGCKYLDFRTLCLDGVANSFQGSMSSPGLLR